MTTYTATTESSLNGLFKQVYPDGGPVDAIPRTSVLQKNIKFDSSKKLGDFYNFPVILTDEMGASYGGSNGDAFAINSAVPMTTKNAQVRGSEFIINGVLSYGAASRATAEGEAAFASATSLQMENMINSHSKRREIELLYGTSPNGLGAGATANVNTTTTTWTPSAGQWSYLWVASKNALLDVYSSVNVKLNTNAAVTVSTVNISAKTLTLTGNATDIAAIDTSSGSNPVRLFFYGAYGNEMIGIDAIMSNTGSQFGIDASVYDLWKGNLFAVGGNLDYSKIGDAVSLAQSRGLEEDVDLLTSSKSWRYLNDNVVANRRYDSSYDKNKSQTGSEVLEYYTQSGVLRVHSHNYVKEGEAFLLPFDRFRRVGSTDITFNTPGNGNMEIFRQLEQQAGFEYRTYSDFAIICEVPARNVKFTGITNA